MFKEIKLTDVKENFVDLFKNRWGLVAAGNENGFNMMTVSWGAVGELWGQDTATVYIRPQRYTEEFVNKEDYFTVCFFPDDMKKQVHSVCGSESGRDVDKAYKCSITPDFSQAAPYFKEAQIVLVCRKTAKSRFNPNEFIDGGIDLKWYPEKDYHYVYYGAVEKVLISE